MKRRVIAGLVASVLVLLGTNALSPDAPNGSSDGRYHTCGYVTEDGVTEYLDTYIARCGDATLAGDTP